jgi:pyocin large subunit-like protein
MTIDEYLSRAKTLLNSKISGPIEGFISKEGWIFRYNQTTNELAIAKPNGTIETLFRPADGQNYWTEQIRKYK